MSGYPHFTTGFLETDFHKITSFMGIPDSVKIL
jgi:hypothetical protein